MLNKDKQRELAYIVKVDSVEPIEGYDRIAYATVGGWHCVVGTDIKAGDKAVYFEIDSLLPSDDERFTFCQKYKYKIKTQKYVKGKYISQGLLMPISEFPELADRKIGDFVTKDLKVTYYDPMDRARKIRDNQIEMNSTWKKVKNKFPFKQLMRTKYGREILLIIFGVKKKKQEWPSFVPKTDEERIQNVIWQLKDKSPLEVTEKIDGTSSTFAIKKRKFRKPQIWVCSRNVVLTRNKSAYYDSNYWFEMYDKYNIEQVLTKIMNDLNVDWVYLQAETYGDGVQKRNYSLTNERKMAAFILCTSDRVRYSYEETKAILEPYGIPTVPLLKTDYVLPDNIDEVIKYAQGASEIDGLPREGLVFRRVNDSTVSFKAVDPEFLMKFH